MLNKQNGVNSKDNQWFTVICKTATRSLTKSTPNAVVLQPTFNFNQNHLYSILKIRCLFVIYLTCEQPIFCQGTFQGSVRDSCLFYVNQTNLLTQCPVNLHSDPAAVNKFIACSLRVKVITVISNTFPIYLLSISFQLNNTITPLTVIAIIFCRFYQLGRETKPSGWYMASFHYDFACVWFGIRLFCYLVLSCQIYVYVWNLSIIRACEGIVQSLLFIFTDPAVRQVILHFISFHFLLLCWLKCFEHPLVT